MKQYATVITKSVNLRDIPNGKDIGEVYKGDRLAVLDREQRKQHLWIRVRVVGTRLTGWVAANPKWIKIDDPIPEPPFTPAPYDYTALWVSAGLLVAGLVALFIGGWL